MELLVMSKNHWKSPKFRIKVVLNGFGGGDRPPPHNAALGGFANGEPRPTQGKMEKIEGKLAFLAKIFHCAVIFGQNFSLRGCFWQKFFACGAK